MRLDTTQLLYITNVFLDTIFDEYLKQP